MAKSSYKIPVSIDRSRLNHKITLQAWQLKSKPISIKIILYWVLFIFVTAWVVTQSPLSAAPWIVLVFLVIWMTVTAAVLGKQTKTGDMKFMQLPALLEYIPTRKRKVMTRTNSKPYGFLSIVGIKDVEASGIIRYVNGDVAQLYSIVGSASALLFEGDRNAIIRRVDNFHQKIDSGPSWCYMTTKESQRVFQQIAAIEHQNRELRHRDPELLALEQEKLDVLVNDVGGQFSSLHQYLLVRATSMKELKAAHRVLRAERENSSLMFRRCELLNGPDGLEVLRSVYQSPGKDRIEPIK
ncbi:hypothetical protein U2G91_26385 (plasmid) [Rhodococcoides fascians]|uniref:hypothetical protein n=1 Tax=Nocardiaceae TaxID=85025 RepID=UPI001AE9B7D4|nr:MULTISPECIES: hypothetical protein [Rhodococcus]MBP2527442.1 hypothetical protein [Rhodococcus sp. PvP104]WQH31336.1 hypothetical protein U2G91_26385 [Rhodococcus fascians]